VSGQAIKLSEKLGLFSDHWSPRIVARANEHHFKLAKIQGEFVWHSHEDTDEVFLVLGGQMIVELRDGKVELGAGELYVVPRGVEHRTLADKECQILIVARAGTVNTGKTGGPLTADDDVWI
jgi:mannose-6-phosphate isomerase-like protein (cupin superfamily)